MPNARSLSLVRHAALCAALALIVGACSGAAAGWTFVPEPSPTPVPSATAAPSGSVAPSASVSAAPSGSGSPAPSGSGAATTVKIAALNIAFDTKEIQVPGGQPFVIEFDNQDNGIPHNVAIKDASGADVFKGEIFNGPGQKTYQVAPLTKGTAYTFACEVHPTMTGTVTVQ